MKKLLFSFVLVIVIGLSAFQVQAAGKRVPVVLSPEDLVRTWSVVLSGRYLTVDGETAGFTETFSVDIHKQATISGIPLGWVSVYDDSCELDETANGLYSLLSGGRSVWLDLTFRPPGEVPEELKYTCYLFPFSDKKRAVFLEGSCQVKHSLKDTTNIIEVLYGSVVMKPLFPGCE